MTQAAFGGSVYNSTVYLWLRTAQGDIPLRQAGAEFVIPAEPVELPRDTTAFLIVSIDGDEHHRQVLLPDGMTAAVRKVRVVSCLPDGLPF